MSATDNITEEQLHALHHVLHELTTLHGLVAADGEAPDETFPIDTSDARAHLEAAFPQLKELPGPIIDPGNGAYCFQRIR